MAISQVNQVAIAQICVYVPALAIAIVLALRHGFRRSSGWLYLILFCLIRVVGASMQLATINDPTNSDLYVGAFTLNSIGLSALILIMLGLTTRLSQSIQQSQTLLINPRSLRLVQTVVMVGLILGIVGGTQMGDQISNMFKNPGQTTYDVPQLSKVGVGLMIGGYGILVIANAKLGTQISHAEPGEKRVLIAIAAAMPFVLVRLIFSAMATFTTNRNFRSFGGGPDYIHYFIGMAVVMEMVAIAIFEGVGLTLQKKPVKKGYTVPMGNRVPQQGQPQQGHPQQPQPYQSQYPPQSQQQWGTRQAEHV